MLAQQPAHLSAQLPGACGPPRPALLTSFPSWGPDCPPTRYPQVAVLPSGLPPLLGSSWENSPHGVPQPWAQTVSRPDWDPALLASVSPGLAVTPGQLS